MAFNFGKVAVGGSTANLKNSSEVFVTHIPGSRDPQALKKFKGKVHVVVWPQFANIDPVKEIPFWDASRMDLVPVGSPISCPDTRNNIIDYCAKNGITKFWTCDDDVNAFRQVQNDKLAYVKDNFDVSTVYFEKNVAYGGLSSAGVMFNSWKKTRFAARMVWGIMFFDLDYFRDPHTKEILHFYRMGFEDIEMNLRCYKLGVKTQTVNDAGFSKPVWFEAKKKITNASPITKQWQFCWDMYKLHGENVIYNVRFWGANQERIFNPAIRTSSVKNYVDPPVYKFPIDTIDNFRAALTKAYETGTGDFKHAGLPQMKGKSVGAISDATKAARSK
jgi:hypothetical protein